MIITRLKLKNWRNFRSVDINLRERVYIIGPNASGKSNLLDTLRFLRDIASQKGGGLQKAVADRGKMTKLRSLHARRDPEIIIEVELAESADSDPKWLYVLGLKSEGHGLRRPVVSQEIVKDLEAGKTLLSRPDSEDKKDSERLTQTHLEQINANKAFREIADFFSSVTYLHLVPQLLKYSEQLGGFRLENDPFGQAFLERIAKSSEKTRVSRLKRIEEALKVCVPNMRELKFIQDPITGKPHLEALYEHWRPDAGWQREDQFSDGTLRLLGIMWSLLEGDSLLLLEEPELSLNEEIVRNVPGLIWKMQKSTKKQKRQVFVTTHSHALLSEKSLDAREIIWLEPTDDGTKVHELSERDKKLIESGYSVADIVLPKVKPSKIDQMSLFNL